MISAVRKLTEEYEIKVSDEHIKAAVKNIELLHLGDDGFIAIAAKEDMEWSQFHYKVEDLSNNIAKAISLEANVYITPNSFFRPFRKIENIRHLNALYIDVDYYKIEKYKKCDPEYMMNMIYNEYFESGLLPEPTFTLFTGQGLAYYWKIEPCPITVLPLWNVIQRYFLETLQDVGGDMKSIDSARVMRLAGSIHMLNITDKEMMEIQTIISGDEKKRGKNIKQNAVKRNEQGLTKKQIEKINRLECVQELYEQGYKQTEMAEKLNINQSQISRDLREIKEQNIHKKAINWDIDQSV